MAPNFAFGSVRNRSSGRGNPPF